MNIVNGKPVAELGPYGCHNREGYKAFYYSQACHEVIHFRGTRECMYDRNREDERCEGCRWIARMEHEHE